MSEEERKLICKLGLNKLRHNYDQQFYNQYDDLNIGYEYYQSYGELWDKAKSYNNNYFQKRNRVNKRIKNIINSTDNVYKCYFCTFTFTDKFLAPPFSKESRRKHFREFCNKYFKDYIANIDFGKKGGREHYHAVVLTDVCAVWERGFYSYELIKITKNDLKRVSLYLTKLTNHSMKEYGRCERLIFSRKKRKD